MEKIKQFLESQKGKDILTVFIVVLVGLGSFFLGRLSKESQTSGLKIEYNGGEVKGISTELLKTSSIPQPTLKKFFASKKGKKYYNAGCSAGKSIKLENRVYFETREEAEQAGFELSTSCR